MHVVSLVLFFFFQAEDGIRDSSVTGVQTCALPIFCLFGRRLGRLAVAVTCERMHRSYSFQRKPLFCCEDTVGRNRERPPPVLQQWEARTSSSTGCRVSLLLSLFRVC